MKPMLPWWSCSAMILDGADEIDADLEVRAATAGDRAEWADMGLGADAVKVRRCDQ